MEGREKVPGWYNRCNSGEGVIKSCGRVGSCFFDGSIWEAISRRGFQYVQASW